MKPLMGISTGKIQQNLSDSSNKVSKSFERLSSGLRINRASDDSAGLSLASQLNADRRIVTRGLLNISDGLSVAQIADSAIGELSSITSRIAELAQQSANGILSANQREALDEEAQALKSEYQRIVDTTSFNGQKVLQASYGELRVQTGRGLDGGFQSSLGGRVGDGSFSVTSAITTGASPWTVETGDFNNDGVTDLMTGNLGGDNISVILGNGDGSFRSAVSYALDANINPRAASTADFNGDGNLDIASANNAGDNVSILLGRGDGTFAAHVNYAAGDGTRWIEAADYNKDGAIDIATVNEFDNTMSVLLGQGDGTFSSAVNYAIDAALGARTATAGDLNGDGNLDLVTTSEASEQISVLLGRGDGTFENEVTYATGGAARNAVIEDFDRNGTMDVAVTNSNTATIAIFSGSGNGTLSLTNTLSIGGGGDSRGLLSTDFNGDGTKDLVATREGDDSVIFFSNDGSSNFTAGAITSGLGDFPISIAAGDFDADGVLDLAVSNADFLTSRVSILIGNSVAGTSTLMDFSLKTQAGAREAVTMLKNKVGHLAEQRGHIGAFQSRMAVATSYSQVKLANLRAAESKIMDIDVAEEVAELTRNKILQNVSTALLAQANQNPSALIDLLF